MPNIKINPAVVILVLAVSNFFMACSGKLVDHRRLNANEYQVRHGDVLEIKFDYYPDFDQTVIVGPDGKTSFQDIEELQVKDLTISELRQNLMKKYGKVLASPGLQVKVHESSKFSIYVGGHIKKPGMVKFKKALRADGSQIAIQHKYSISRPRQNFCEINNMIQTSGFCPRCITKNHARLTCGI